MKEKQYIDYRLIEEALEFLIPESKLWSNSEKMAEKLSLSMSDFYKLFRHWAGVEPKVFFRNIRIQNIKRMLTNSREMLSDMSYEEELSHKYKRHDWLVNINPMTAEELQNEGENLKINYYFVASTFGDLMVASTFKGICYMAFADDYIHAIKTLKKEFPKAIFSERTGFFQESLELIFEDDWEELPQIELHLKGTTFQLEVWESLLKIPMGKLSTYKIIAQKVGNPDAWRAVGTAVGSNPVSFLIPCHRVVKSNGMFGGYHWGITRKIAMIGWEQARMNFYLD